MGIYDRDYYRKEGPSFLDSFTVRGQATKWLLIITISVFVLQIVTRVQLRDPFNRPYWEPGWLTKFCILDPDAVLHGEIWRLFTYAFLHDDGTGPNPAGGWYFHIVFNMLMLFWFGTYVEEIYGQWEFVAFYLTAALAGGLAFMLEHTFSQRFAFCLGASGAVMAVLVLVACYYPQKTVLLFFVIPTPIWVVAALYVLQDALGFISGSSKGNTAFGVHLGGAAFALLYWRTHWRILRVWQSFKTWRKERSRPKLRVFQPDDEAEPVPVGPSPRHDVDEQLEAKVDAVLEKVARHGQASLTDAEKQILLRASEVYKKRRT